MLFLGETLVSAEGQTWGVPVSSDANIAYYRRLAIVAGSNRCLLFDQLSSQGGQIWWAPGSTAYGPSAVPHAISGMRPAEMTRQDVRMMRRAFVRGAHRVADGGLDGCEIKADQGKLVAQFLSRRFNRRSDAYGQSIENRMRFMREILSDIRDKYRSLCLGVRMALGTEYAQGDQFPDLSYTEAEDIIATLVDEELIDFVSISTATNSWPKGYRSGHCDSFFDAKSRDTIAFRLRQLSRLCIPFLYAGQFNAIDEANKLLDDGTCDFVGFARAHIADPFFTEKIVAGRDDEIRPCIRCTQGCVGSTWEGMPIRCTVNPDAGVESKKLTRSRHKSICGNMLVIGAGPAGLECALSAADLGWRVVIAERNASIGGRLRDACRVPCGVKWEKLIAYYSHAIDRRDNIECLFKTNVNLGDQKWQGFDAVAFAGGREYRLPEEYQHIEGKIPVYSVAGAIRKMRELQGQPILFVDEGPFEGTLSLAVMLQALGARVRVITTQEYVGKGLDQVSIARLVEQMRLHGVLCNGLMEVSRLEKTVAVLRCLCTGRESRVVVAAVILGIAPLTARLPEAVDYSQHINLIGDAMFPRGVQYALADARKFVYKVTHQKGRKK